MTVHVAGFNGLVGWLVHGVECVEGSAVSGFGRVGGVFFVLGVVRGWVGLVVCVTSCEGHMVDALASRADEGRRSLR